MGDLGLVYPKHNILSETDFTASQFWGVHNLQQRPRPRLPSFGAVSGRSRFRPPKPKSPASAGFRVARLEPKAEKGESAGRGSQCRVRLILHTHTQQKKLISLGKPKETGRRFWGTQLV